MTSLASYGVPVVIGLIAMPIAFRLLGASGFGVLSIALVTPALASSLDLGVSTAAVRRLAPELEQRAPSVGRTLATYAAVLVAIATILAILVAVFAADLAAALRLTAELGPSAALDLVQLCAGWIWLTLALALPAVVLRARQRFAELAAVQSVAALSQWTGVIGIAASGGGPFAMIGLSVFLTVASAVACALLARRDLPPRPGYRFDPDIVRADAQFAGGLFMMQLSSSLAVQVDRLVVASLASPSAAGVYALCVGIANKSLFAVSALTSFAYPRVAAMRGRNMDGEIGELLRALLRVSVVLVAPTVAPALMLAGPFLLLWLGRADEASVRLLQLLWVGYAVAAVCAPATHVTLGTGASRVPAAFAWLTALLLLGAMYVLIPEQGLLGAGWANVIAFSSSLLFLFVARRQLSVPRDPDAKRVLSGVIAGCLVQTLLLYALHSTVTTWLGFVLAGAGSLAVYQAVRWAMRAITAEERRLLHSIAARLR